MSKRQSPGPELKSPPILANFERLMLRSASLGWREFLALSLVGALIVAIVLHPILLTTKYFYGSGTDLVSLEYPLREYFFFWWRQGVWPLWNPYVFNGLPLQTGIHPMAYPPLAIGALVGTAKEIWFYILFHSWLGWLGMAGLLRWLGHSRAVSLVVASGYSLGGFPLNHLFGGHLAVFACFAYIPWIVLATLQAMRCNGVVYCVSTGALLAWVALLGSYQMLHQILLLALSMTFLTALLGSRYRILPLNWRNPWSNTMEDRASESPAGAMLTSVPWIYRCLDALHTATRWLVILTVGLALSAFQWLPQAATLGEFNLSRVNFSDWQVTPVHLLTLLIPHLFERTFVAQSWTYWIGWESGIYLSIPVALCAAMAWLQPVRLWVLQTLMALGFAVLCLGGSPLSWYARFDPVIGWFEAPGRFTAAVSFCLCLLAAIGFEATLRGFRLESRRLLLWTLFGLMLLLVTMLFYLDPRAGWWHALVRSLTTSEEWREMTTRHRFPERPEALLVATTLRTGLATSLVFVAVVLLSARRVARHTGTLLLLTLIDLTVAANPYLELAPESRFHIEPELARFFNAQLGAQRWIPFEISIPANWSAPAGRSTSAGYDLATLRSYDRAVSVQLGFPPETRVMRLSSEKPSNLLRLQGTSFYLAGRGPDGPLEKVNLSGLKHIGEVVRGAHIFVDPGALPRAQLVGNVQVAPDQNVLEQILKGPAAFQSSVFLSEAPPGFSAQSEAPARPVRSIRILPNQVLIETDVGPASILVLSDAYFPGWRAEVDGQPVSVLRANAGLHRAVILPPGSHRVRFFFEPLWLRQGLWISLACALVLGCWLTLARLAHGRRFRSSSRSFHAAASSSRP